MTSDERIKTEFTVRMYLRQAIDELQAAGKSFDEMRGFVARFVEEQLYELTNAHKAVIKTIPKIEFARAADLKNTYDELCLALQNCRDGIMTEIKYREEKHAKKETQPR
jgi:hypothetical protein